MGRAAWSEYHHRTRKQSRTERHHRFVGNPNLAVGDLNKIKRIVKLMALVNSAPTFTEQHLVANGASELLAEVFGQGGTHARSAFGAAQLPFGSCVEIDLIVEVRDR